MERALAEGADPDEEYAHWGGPLHQAAEWGTPEVVAELTGLVSDVDAERLGCTALWRAVYAGNLDNVRVLVAAGADPWRPMMRGWSPARLSLAGPTPDLFAGKADAPDLSAEEAAAAAEAKRLIAALGGFRYEG